MKTEVPKTAPMDKGKVIDTILEYLREEIAEATDADARQELERLMVIYRFLPRREHAESDPIIPSSLVELDLNGTSAYYFVAPQGGGLVTRIGDSPLQVITPQSPLGEALLGKKSGDEIQVQLRNGSRTYRVKSAR